MAVTIYNFSTLVTSYLYKSELGEVVRPIDLVDNNILNETELGLKTLIVEIEKEFGTPTLEYMKSIESGRYSNMFPTRIDNGKLVPLKAHNLSYDLLLSSFYEFATERNFKDIINNIDFDSDEFVNIEAFMQEVGSIPSLTFADKKEVFRSYEEEISILEEEQSEGMYLGINPFMDGQIGKQTRGRLGIIAAEAGANKTYVSLFLAFRAAFIEKRKVLFCTYEMTAEDVGKRLKAMMGQYNTRLYTVETDKNQQILKANLKIVCDYLVDLYMSSGKLVILEDASIPDIKAHLDDEIEETGDPFFSIIIDGAYLVPPLKHLQGAADWQKLVSNLDMLKKLKLGKWEGDKYGITYNILLTSQMKAGKEGNTLGDLGKSERLGQDATFVVNIKVVSDNIRSSRILKNRNGDAPAKDYLYAIDYNTTTLLAPTVENHGDDLDQYISIHTDGWKSLFDVIDKKDLGKFIDLDKEGADALKLSLEHPDLNTPVKYNVVDRGIFIYPWGSKEDYDKFSKADKERWTLFTNANRNVNMTNAYANVYYSHYLEE